MRPGVLRHRLDAWIDPAAAYCTLHRDDDRSFWLDSSIGTGRSYMGSGSRAVVGDDGARVFAQLRSGLREHRVDAGDGGFALGWVGWLGYELRGYTMDAPHETRSPHPLAAFLFADRAIEFDHDRQSVSLLALGTAWTGDLAEWRDRVVAALREPDAVRITVPAPAEAVWRDNDEAYLRMVEECRRAIRRGDAYQLCLTTQARIAASPHPLEAYLRLRESSPTHHGGLVRIDGVALLSASPEQFLEVTPGNIVSTSPIKGTRPRGRTVQEDDRLRTELGANEKERAENLMIVDLMRNDLSRVCEVGSVAVERLFGVESYAQVHQLVSTVRGRLASGLDALDAVLACFPAGSMTGAPKLRATQLLDALEREPRGIYSGVFGFLGLDGAADLAVVIRSIVLDAAGAWIGAGGGITALSQPEAELAEVKLKADALLDALGAHDN